MTRNQIIQCDVLDGLRELPDNSVDLVITSPPYNKAGINGRCSRFHASNWEQSINYNGDIDVDCMPEPGYEDWQVEVLNQLYRVLKQDGSVFYNHKNRIVRRQGYIISPWQWITRTPFLVRQVITWDRRSSPSVNNQRYLPVTEEIFWLAKSATPRFRRPADAPQKTEVWSIPYEQNTTHPAPFPIDIPDAIIPCVAQGERILVLDPFIGSGTTAVSAMKHDCDFLGFELFKEYVDMAKERMGEVPGWTCKWDKWYRA